MIVYKDNEYNFIEYFNEENGFLLRSDNLSTNKNATQRSFPELLDIGIMGQCEASKNHLCSNFGVDCYQMALLSKRKNMSFSEYKHLIDQCPGKVFQVALGGAGDPNKHPNFEQILSYTKSLNIVPNYTTSGFNISEEEIRLTKLYCGSVAVSFYTRLIENRESSPSTINAIKKFIDAKIPTNIHYVISNETIDEAIYRLENNLFPESINAIIFLLYKPSGFGKAEKVITFSDDRLKRLINIVENNHFSYSIGFDTCFTPALISYSKKISINSIDFCEAARFSMYIDCELNAYPCSFDSAKGTFKYNISNSSIEQAWNSSVFTYFRQQQEINCKCKYLEICMGGCLLFNTINLCGKK